MLQGQTHLDTFFFPSFSSLGTHGAHTFRNFKRSCVMLYAAHPSAVATLSIVIVSSNQHFHPLHSCFCCNLNRATLSGVMCDFNTSLREFIDPIVKNTSHRKQETFLYEYYLHWVILPTKKNARHNAALQYYTPRAWLPFWLLKAASEHAHSRLLRTL
jgi:hypothetical protein